MPRHQLTPAAAPEPNIDEELYKIFVEGLAEALRKTARTYTLAHGNKIGPNVAAAASNACLSFAAEMVVVSADFLSPGVSLATYRELLREEFRLALDFYFAQTGRTADVTNPDVFIEVICPGCGARLVILETMPILEACVNIAQFRQDHATCQEKEKH